MNIRTAILFLTVAFVFSGTHFWWTRQAEAQAVTASTVPSPTSTVPGDLNNSSSIDIFDYNILVQNFGRTGSPGFIPADINRDAKVDIFDYNILVENFGRSVNSTPQPTVSPPRIGAGVWISQQEITALPTSGAAWDNLISWASRSIGSPSINNQDSDQDQIALAKAYACARVGQHCSEVIAALNAISAFTPTGDRVLAWGRNLSTWIIAADVAINSGRATGLHVTQFRNWVNTAINTATDGGSIQACHENWVNNWGTMCGGSRIAALSFLDNTSGLARAWDVYRGYVGDTNSGAYRGFNTGISCTNWRCPGDCDDHWVNPKNCTKNGKVFDGMLPQEMHRNGEWDENTWPPVWNTSYPFNGMAGLIVQAEILSRRGYPSYSVADQAMLRAYSWPVDVARWNVNWASKAAWMPWVINKRYNRNYPASLPVEPGQNVGFVDWTHAR